MKIQKDSEVRLKIIGTRVDATEIVCASYLIFDHQGVLLISDNNFRNESDVLMGHLSLCPAVLHRNYKG